MAVRLRFLKCSARPSVLHIHTPIGTVTYSLWCLCCVFPCRWGFCDWAVREFKEKNYMSENIFFFRILTKEGLKRPRTWKLKIDKIYHGKASHLDRNIKFVYWNALLIELLKWQTSTVLRTQYRNRFTSNTEFWTSPPSKNHHCPFILQFLKFCIAI
jgi:hypothetical protein